MGLSLGSIGSVVGGIAGAWFGGPAGAAAGSSIGGALGGSLDASAAAKDSQQAYERAQAAQLAFQQQRYDDWKAVYGDLQENLAETVKGLSPETYAGTALSSFNAEKVLADKRIRAQLAQRGIYDSGIAANVIRQNELGAAERRAEIKVLAPDRVREIQENFLRIGLGQNPASGVANVLSQAARHAGNIATQAAGAQGQASQALTRSIGGAFGMMGSAGSMGSAQSTNMDLYNNPTPSMAYLSEYNIL